MDVAGADTVVELNMRLQFDLRNRNVVKIIGSPFDDTMNFVEIDWFGAAIPLRHHHDFGFFHFHFCVPFRMRAVHHMRSDGAVDLDVWWCAIFYCLSLDKTTENAF